MARQESLLLLSLMVCLFLFFKDTTPNTLRRGLTLGIVTGLSIGLHPNSFLIAQEAGIEFSFDTKTVKDAHRNTAILSLCGVTGKRVELQTSSIGGGRIMLNKLDGIDVNFAAERPTLVVHNIDMPGHVAKVASMLYESKVNIATMQYYRSKRGGDAVMVLELDQGISMDIVSWVEKQQGITKVTYIDMQED
jgi:L-serine dehydratase